MKKAKTNRERMRSFLLQGLLAGLVCFCVLGILGWGYEGLSLSGMNRAFEETDYFCETVEEIIRDKITAQQDILLFEEDGEYNELKEIDIQQYVSDTSQNQEPNPNTSYYICDLIEFGEDGAARMQSRINSLMNAGSGGNDLSAGRVLYNESAVLETIYPVSGHSLADYAQISSNPDAAVLETYRTLCDVSRDIAYRYRNYTEMQEGGEDPVKAPSNVYYYVEDYNTGSRYTNLGVKSLVAARTLVSEKENVRLLFEGDRRFNIMVSAADHPVNDNTSVYFMQSRFTGNSESVLIAYDTTYAAGDELQSSAVFYRQRKPYLIRALAVGIAALILLSGLLLACVADAFRYGSTASTRRRSAFPAGFEAVPTEIALGIILILCIEWWMVSRWAIEQLPIWSELPERLGWSAAVCVEYWIALTGLLHMVLRIRSGGFWRNSVIYTVIMSGRQVYSARRSSERLVIAYVGFVILNMVFLLIGGIAGGIMALILNFAALLYLMRDVVGSKSVREGLDQISKGKLEYRINTQVLTGESREMGEAVNEMGEGLQRSVSAMLEHERLKSELITNVSHDLKTPLTSIMNYVDLLKKEQLPEGNARSYVEILDNKTRRLKQLTEDLIEVSRINSGNVHLDMQPLQIWYFLQQACGEFEDRFEENDLSIDLSRAAKNGQKENWMILADGAQLWRVFENLLGNAAKYSRPGTKVSVRLSAEGDHIQVRVSNIPSIPVTLSAQELEERFTRGDASRSTEGSGLGLSIAKSLTEYMGGTFSLNVGEELFEAQIVFPERKDLH